MAYILGRLASGEKVYDRVKDSYTKTKPEMLPLIREGLKNINVVNDQDYILTTITFAQITGLDYCVEVDPQNRENIYYAKIVGRKGHSRFVSGIEPAPTNRLTLLLNRRNSVKRPGYNLVAVRPGERFLPEPWKTRVIEELSFKNPKFAKDVWKFWKVHAFAEGYKPIVISTKTKKLPWQPPY